MPAETSRRPPVWILVSAAWFGPAVLAALKAYMHGRIGSRPPATWRSIAWEGGDWLLYALLTPLVFVLARRFPLARGRLRGRIALHFWAALALCAAWAGGGMLLRWSLFPEEGAPSARDLASWFFTSLPFGVAVYFCVLGVEHASRYFLEARERETQAARLEAQLAQARLGALRMQMQPHFLLNALNAVMVIVRDEDKATATRVLEHLGEILRRVVRSDRPQETRLEEELAFVREVLAIEEVRFSDRLRPVFRVEPGLEAAAVPEFVLQPLVENALRHGLARREGATRLEIAARREGQELVLTVTDDGPGPASEEPLREGVGLANTRARLETLYGVRASLTLARTSEGGAVVTVRLPYRRLEEGHG